jgi:hypothetical protein
MVLLRNMERLCWYIVLALMKKGTWAPSQTVGYLLSNKGTINPNKIYLLVLKKDEIYFYLFTF